MCLKYSNLAANSNNFDQPISQYIKYKYENITISNTARLYRQWRKPMIYSATYHWAETRNAIWCRSDIVLTIC